MLCFFFSFKIELYPLTTSHGHPLILFSYTCPQVILESLDKGVREARQQVHAWLALLAARYNQALSSDARTPLSSIDVDFSQCPKLQMVPQLVFALLRSPLLRLHEEGVHPDYRIYLQCLFRFIIFFKLSCSDLYFLSSNFHYTKVRLMLSQRMLILLKYCSVTIYGTQMSKNIPCVKNSHFRN